MISPNETEYFHHFDCVRTKANEINVKTSETAVEEGEEKTIITG